MFYYPFVDKTDDTYGHGTHVSGTVAGSSITGENSDFNGIASKSKIAFFDIGNSSNGVLSVPGNIASDLFYPLYKAGARVFSNSWGSSGDGANAYTTDARAVDAFMVTFPDTLILFAAGNSGAYGSSTVVSPSTNKNGMCIGAGLNDQNSFYSSEGEASSKMSKITPFYETPLMSIDKVAYFSVNMNSFLSIYMMTFITTIHFSLKVRRQMEDSSLTCWALDGP